MTVVAPEQLTLDDLIDRAIASSQLQDQLVHRRDLPKLEVGGCERLLTRLVRLGLPENALRSAAHLVVALEQAAVDQKDTRAHL